MDPLGKILLLLPVLSTILSIGAVIAFVALYVRIWQYTNPRKPRCVCITKCPVEDAEDQPQTETGTVHPTTGASAVPPQTEQ